MTGAAAEETAIAARPRRGDLVEIVADHPSDFWGGAVCRVRADFGERGWLVAYRQEETGENLFIAVVPAQAWSDRAHADVTVCGTVVKVTE